MKKLRKLPGFFSFKNPKLILLTAIVVGFAAGGSYWLYASSSASIFKDLRSAQGCQASGVVLRKGSTGSCVRAVQTILNYSRVAYGSKARWNNLDVDGKYGPATALTVAAYQIYINENQVGNPIGGGGTAEPLVVDGVVGPKTWVWFSSVTCDDLYHKGIRLVACGWSD